MNSENASDVREWFHLGPFTFFDLETTGMSPVRDRIVEIAALRVEKDGSRSSFSSLVNPGVSIPYSAFSVHGISNEMVANAPKFHSIAPEFIKFADESTLVAHNARFDLGFLQESLARHAYEIWKGKTLDSLPIIKKAYPGLPKYNLQFLRNTFGLEIEEDQQAHRAASDVAWTVEIFAMAMKTLMRTL